LEAVVEGKGFQFYVLRKPPKGGGKLKVGNGKWSTAWLTICPRALRYL